MSPEAVSWDQENVVTSVTNWSKRKFLGTSDSTTIHDNTDLRERVVNRRFLDVFDESSSTRESLSFYSCHNVGTLQ